MAISSAYSSALESLQGHPGDALPKHGPASSNVLLAGYGLMAGWHRPVHTFTPLAAGNSIGSSLSGALIYYNGFPATTGELQITLCDPRPGLWFEFAGMGAIGSTKLTEWDTASATGCFLVGGDSGGADKVAFSSTLGDITGRVSFIGISTSKYVVSHSLAGTALGPIATGTYDGIAAVS